MASLSLKHLYKVYEGTTRAVNDFSMEIRDKEFIVFVGPSGCGKSTTLRMIAGLEDITAGELRIDGEVVNDKEPGDRNVAMVFQNYALYPHMTVYENMAFALRTARVPKEIIHEKVTEAARILGITEYLERKPRALSGGQRQRVALGRAMVRSPKVFLLDEPLSNLDAKLRAAMRGEIIRLHRRLATTFIYVTHDQVEAMTMGTRIVVMKDGVVQQIDTPKNLYNHPTNRFVAGFIGTPRMNFWDGVMEKRGDTVEVRLDRGGCFTLPYPLLDRMQTHYMDSKHPLTVGLRPDDLRLWQEDLSPTEWACLPAVIQLVESPGGETLLYGSLDPSDPDGDRASVIAKAPADCPLQPGDRVLLGLRLSGLHVFHRETEESLLPRIPSENRCPCVMTATTLSFGGQKFSLPPALRGIGGERSGIPPREASPLCLPADAILPGTGSGRATVTAVTPLAEPDLPQGIGTLYRLSVGELVLFARERGEPRFAVGDAVPFDPDYSRITVESHGIFPLPEENMLEGRFTREKETDDRGRRRYRFYLDLEDRLLEAEESLRERLFSAGGTGVFRLSLEYRFPPEAVTLAPASPSLSSENRSRLVGKVTAVLDYGRSTYARVALGGQSLYAPCTSPCIPGATVFLSLDQELITVTDREKGIVLV